MAAGIAACTRLFGQPWPDPVSVVLPGGQTPSFGLEMRESGDGWARAAVRKDAGDDPDVTHQALIITRVSLARPGSGLTFQAGDGVGTVTRPGLPLPVGEPAINPAPRRMISEALSWIANAHGRPCDLCVEISIPGGRKLASQTWNARLGILGGLSILGTTGIVKPYSCSAWIASVHMGVDVARANGLEHVVGSTGSVSEATAQRLYLLPDHAMLDMGDFAGGLLKYLRRHPVPRLTIAGGIGKLTKLAQGASDLHSSRSQVDFPALAALAAESGRAGPELARSITAANTARMVLDLAGPELADAVARRARIAVQAMLREAPIEVEIMIIDRDGTMIVRHSRVPFPPLRVGT